MKKEEKHTREKIACVASKNKTNKIPGHQSIFVYSEFARLQGQVKKKKNPTRKLVYALRIV